MRIGILNLMALFAAFKIAQADFRRGNRKHEGISVKVYRSRTLKHSHITDTVLAPARR